MANDPPIVVSITFVWCLGKLQWTNDISSPSRASQPPSTITTPSSCVSEYVHSGVH